ncbi:MAG: hypothetical protein ACRC2A_04890 [Enterobacterales bacterium]|uniref:hypothetical protein n=1 Tax=Serratia sp. (in: enterobacteria) TaxID=616 RepID=UPI003F36E5BD
MKQINTAEANAIVGGTIPKTCIVKYGQLDTGACMETTTCEDKFGAEVSKTSVKVASSLCNGKP